MNNSYVYSGFNDGYPSYYDHYNQNYNSGGHIVKGKQDDRFIGGGFAFPFLLGGVTGAAIAPAFWRPGFGYNRPFYGPAPFYGPYRPF